MVQAFCFTNCKYDTGNIQYKIAENIYSDSLIDPALFGINGEANNMAVKEILLLGNSKLYELSEPVSQEEVENLKQSVEDLHDTLIDFRKKYGAGRAIAAPQIGVRKRLIYMFIDKPVVFINPELIDKSEEMFEVLDDCMSFPGLFVKVKRHKSCKIRYKDMDWNDCIMNLDGDLSELLQHEYDHLDGILAVMRAIDNKSLVLKPEYLKGGSIVV